MDGADTGEIILIDPYGCPTDTNILGSLNNGNSYRQTIEANFEAFKFPTSDVVQFKAIVSPCVTACDPIQCGDGPSMGRRKRAANDTHHNSHLDVESGDKLIVVKTLKIEDNFTSKKAIPHDLHKSSRNLDENVGQLWEHSAGGLPPEEVECFNLMPLAIAVSLFLVVQMAVIVTWLRGYVKIDRKVQNNCKLKGPLIYYNSAYASHPSFTNDRSLISAYSYDSATFADLSNYWPK